MMFHDIRRRFARSTVGRSTRVLTKRDKKLILVVTAIQTVMGFVDLAAIGMLGVLGALAVTGIESKTPGNRVGEALKLLGLSHSSFQTQAAILGLVAGFLLVLRTLLSIIFSRRILYFLSRRGALISSRLVSSLLARPLLFVQQKTNQEMVYALTYGVNSVVVGVIGTAVNLVSDSSLLLIIGVGLLIVDPWVAVGSLAVFGSIAYMLYRLLHKRAATLGQTQAELNIQSNESILEVLNSYRESIVRNRREFYAREISKTRLTLADTTAELSFMPMLGKYIIESTVVFGALGLSSVQFILQDAAHAIATLTVFLAAGTRIAPAVLRIQQSLIQLKGGLGTAKPTLDLIESLGETETNHEVVDVVDIVHKGFTPKIEIRNLNFSYSQNSRFAIENLNLDVSPGEFIAIVGISGAGKSTLVDILLGVLDPESGSVNISNESPKQASKIWPGAMGYVPQNVMISNGTIRQNVGLGYLPEFIPDALVTNALDLAQLSDFIQQSEHGLETQVGEGGNKLSGGQRQRLGIARALFTQPKLMVFDEATSALDGETEFNISEAISNLKGEVTIVMIAHRLSTIRNADKVVYMANGKLIKMGTFEEVRSAVPDFDNQARVMGL